MASHALGAWFWCYGAGSVAQMDADPSRMSAAIIVAHTLQFAVLVDLGHYYARACASGHSYRQVRPSEAVPAWWDGGTGGRPP